MKTLSSLLHPSLSVVRRQLRAVLGAAIAMASIVVLTGCGGGGSAAPAVAAPSSVSGTAATGAGIQGVVYLKDSNGQERSVATSTGAFTINIDGLNPPFLLKAQWSASGGVQTMYSFAAQSGVTNITPLTHWVVASAAGGASLDATYASPTITHYQTIATALPAALTAFRQVMAPWLAQYAASNVDVLSDSFSPDHTGIDALLDHLHVTVSGGTAVVTDAITGTVLVNAPLADLSHAAVTADWTAQQADLANDPDVAVDAAGHALAVWADAVSGAINARFLATANANVDVLNGPSGLGMTPRVALDANGNAWVAWADYGSGSNTVWARRFDATTHAWGAAVQLSAANAPADTGSPDLAVDAQGNAVVVWHQGDGRNNHFDQWQAVYAAANHAWSSASLVSDGVNSAYGGRVAMNAAGQGIVVWQQEQGDGTLVSNGPTDVWARTINAAASLGTAQIINSLPATPNQVYGQIAVAMDPAGNGMALWIQGDVQAAIKSASGGWQPSQSILSNGMNGAYGPHVAFDAQGAAVAVWQEQDGVHGYTGTSRYVPGSGWSPSTLLSSASLGDAMEQRVAVDAAGNATAVWYQVNWGSPAQLYTSRYLVGSGWSAALLLSPTTTDGYTTYPVPAVASNASGLTVMIWGIDSN